MKLALFSHCAIDTISIDGIIHEQIGGAAFLAPPATASNHGLLEAVIGNGSGLFMTNVLQHQGITALPSGEIAPAAFSLLSGDVTVKNLFVTGHAFVNQDTAGLAKILISATSVTVTFADSYTEAPVVTITPETKIIGTYWIETISPQGFTIRMDQPQGNAVMFDWHALAVPEKQLFVSDGRHGLARDEYLWITGAREQTVIINRDTEELPTVSEETSSVETQMPPPDPEPSGGPEEKTNPLPFLPFTRG